MRALALPLLALVILAAFGVLWAALAALVVTALALLVGLDRHRQLGHRFDSRRLALREEASSAAGRSSTPTQRSRSR